MFILQDHNKVVARALLCAPLLLASALICFGADARTLSPVLKEKEIKKGEGIIAKLRLLEQESAQSSDFKSYKALMNKLYPALFVEAAELADGDLKTDLTTAVFLYDEALQRYNESGDAVLACRDEARSVYHKLCVDASPVMLRDLLRAKARLHTRWAAAVIDYNSGVRDAATIAALDELREERANDLRLGAQAVEALRGLEREVCVYASLGEFEAHGSLARVSFEQFSQDAGRALPEVERSLRSLPRGPLFYALYHARNAYLDGLFWWRKTYRQKEMVVRADSFTEPEGMKSSNMDAGVVNYTVAINWRKAIRQTREAARLIEASVLSRNQP